MPASLSDLKRDVVLRPTDPAARVALGEALLGEGDRQGAITQLEKAVAIDTTHWPARRLLARAYSLDQRLAHAHRILSESVRLRPADAAVRDELIELFLAAHRLDDALVHAREATQLQPLDPHRWHTLGMMLAQHLLFEPAVKALQQAASLAPGDAAISGSLELVSRELGQLEGTDVSDECARTEAVLAPLQLAGGLAQAARLLAAGDVVGAKRTLVTAPPADRSSAAFLAVKGEIAWAAGDRATTRQAWLKALHLEEKLITGWRRLGDADLVERRYPEAQENYRVALRLDPSDLELRAVLQRAEGLALAAPRADALRGRVGMLAWTPVGGTVSPVQAVTVPGSGLVVVSGNVAEDLKESAVLAHSFVRQRAEPLGLGDRVSTRDIHFHVTHTDARKQGRSAGLAFALAALSAFKEETLPEGLGATGEITLLGDVLPVAGIHEKVIAAHLLDYRTILMPRRNLPDARDLPPEVTSRLKFVFVDTIMEAFRLLFSTPGGTK